MPNPNCGDVLDSLNSRSRSVRWNPVWFADPGAKSPVRCSFINNSRVSDFQLKAATSCRLLVVAGGMLVFTAGVVATFSCSVL